MRKSKKFNLETNEAYQKVLLWFFSYPNKEISLNDLSQTLKISKTTANRITTELTKIDFLNIEVLGRIWRISCNKYHIYNYSKKIGYNLTNIYESGILDLIHKQIPNSRAITLFGSYRKGDDDERSDIDIAVEVLGDEEPKIINIGVLNKIGYRNGIKINVYVFSRNKIDLNLFANIANGIGLEGFLEVRP